MRLRFTQNTESLTGQTSTCPSKLESILVLDCTFSVLLVLFIYNCYNSKVGKS